MISHLLFLILKDVSPVLLSYTGSAGISEFLMPFCVQARF